MLPTDGSAGVPTSSPDKFAGKVIHYGVGPSVDVYSNDQTRASRRSSNCSDGTSSTAYSTFEGGQAKGTNIVNLKLGGRVARARTRSMSGWGKALTDATWYDQLIGSNTDTDSDKRKV